MPRIATAARSAPVFERSRIVQSAFLGQVDYASADRWQRERSGRVASGSEPEIVLFLEHSPTYTQGRRGGRTHLLIPEDELDAPLIDTDRGGDLTFHGPGQLVVWPILRVRQRGIGIARYVRLLEDAALNTCAAFGLAGERVRGRPGVWFEGRKLASVGVRLQAGVSRHGLALNVNTDLSWFDSIVACGIAGAEATSISRETGRDLNVSEVLPWMERAIANSFHLRLSPVDLELGAS